MAKKSILSTTPAEIETPEPVQRREYMVATAHQSALHDLVALVNGHLADGWSLVGGIANIDNGRLAQALTKEV